MLFGIQTAGLICNPVAVNKIRNNTCADIRSQAVQLSVYVLEPQLLIMRERILVVRHGKSPQQTTHQFMRHGLP
jgi:hypothetical protein